MICTEQLNVCICVYVVYMLALALCILSTCVCIRVMSDQIGRYRNHAFVRTCMVGKVRGSVAAKSTKRMRIEAR
jgi:hypothetical protein